MLCACTLILVLPRRKAIIPLLSASILIPFDQIALIGPFHFMMLRVLILFGLLRLLTRARSSTLPLFSGGLTSLDRAMLLFTLVNAINWILLWQQWQTFIFQLGEAYTVLGMYFVLRFFIRDQEDIEITIRVFAYIAVVIAMVMAYEQLNGWNPYALLGGSRSSFFSSLMQRENRLRATGCFLHPILAGTFGAIVLPLFFGLLWTGRKHRRIAIIGIISTVIITGASNSSTPILGYGAGLLGLCFWPLRNWMRLIRWGIVLSLVSLHMVMKAPVWHLISRIDIVGGSSSEHSYQLINQFILHFSDWWLIGAKNNGQWGWDMYDTANQYVEIGQNAGLMPFVLFLAVIVYAFKYIGKARRAGIARTNQLLCWSLGVALFAHVVAFFGISYFDQTIVAWYALLAMISAARLIPVQKEPHRQHLPDVCEGVPLRVTLASGWLDADKKASGSVTTPTEARLGHFI